MRIRRWFLYRDNGALHIERGADPNCPGCYGQGWFWTVIGDDPDAVDCELCACMFGPHWRIPYRPRRRTAAPVIDPWATDQSPF